MKNHGNTVSQKENDSSPKTKLRATEYCNLTDREFKVAVIKKLSELKENTGRQFDKLRNKIDEQKEYFAKETETLRKNQRETLDLKDLINEMKKALEIEQMIWKRD